MYPRISVNLGNILLSLSDALDLARPSLALHQMRTAFVAWEIGKAANLDADRLEKLFISALLHDIGALSVEDKVAVHRSDTGDTEPHCIRGARLFQDIPWLREASQIVRHHHRRWEEWAEMITEPTVFDSQILCLADSIERRIARDTYILHQHSRIQDKARAMAGTEVHGDIVDLFMNASEREEFWLDLTAPRLYSLLLHNGPFCRLDIDLSRIATIARLFKNLIDFKSPYTATHSSGVAESAVCLTRLVGLTELETQLMEVAGYLHDIGKLVVPNAILEKPGKLSRDEFAVIKQHTYVTFSVLSTIPGMLEIAEWAAYHHEKFDGTGYPFRRTAKELNIGARIMAVADIFTALAEDRPYREGMDAAAIQRILQDEAATGRLDKRIVAVLLENIDSIQVVVRRKQEEAREHYAQKVVRGSL